MAPFCISSSAYSTFFASSFITCTATSRSVSGYRSHNTAAPQSVSGYSSQHSYTIVSVWLQKSQHSYTTVSVWLQQSLSTATLQSVSGYSSHLAQPHHDQSQVSPSPHPPLSPHSLSHLATIYFGHQPVYLPELFFNQHLF